MGNGTKHPITREIVEEARRNPSGWVYKIEGAYAPQDRVPPEAVVGAWKVNSLGVIEGEFIPNPNYKASASSEKV
ncbi:hypothetical protein [Herbaspirillum seropedicae]|uniref:hypothetical protein n=1 Tax=Herbaspirillum seropedicae TaxID=964 RepID=UPI003D982037